MNHFLAAKSRSGSEQHRPCLDLSSLVQLEQAVSGTSSYFSSHYRAFEVSQFLLYLRVSPEIAHQSVLDHLVHPILELIMANASEPLIRFEQLPVLADALPELGNPFAG